MKTYALAIGLLGIVGAVLLVGCGAGDGSNSSSAQSEADTSSVDDGKADSNKNACKSAGGKCVALTPTSCSGEWGDAKTYSCGKGLGVGCCFAPGTEPPKDCSEQKCDSGYHCEMKGINGGSIPACIKDAKAPGVECGSKTCAVGDVCCNSSCGICVPPGGHCTDQACL